MENKKEIYEKRFDSFLNKTIIFSSRQYYRDLCIRDSNELKIIDDENYSAYMEEYLQSNDEIYDFTSIDNFIEVFENSSLIHAFKSLSEIEKIVIFLLFEKELTGNEASKELNMHSDSISRIKKRALKKLEDYLKGGM